MPWRVPTFRPRSLPKKPEPRPSSHERGYGSAAWKRLRLQVIARDEGVCRICGLLVTGRGDVDHIVPKSSGGTDELSNLQWTHVECHSRKTATEDS